MDMGWIWGGSGAHKETVAHTTATQTVRDQHTAHSGNDAAVHRIRIHTLRLQALGPHGVGRAQRYRMAHIAKHIIWASAKQKVCIDVCYSVPR